MVDGFRLCCSGPLRTLRGLALIWGTPTARLEGCLGAAARAAGAGDENRRRPIVRTVSELLGREPVHPAEFVFFHPTRLANPEDVLDQGLQPTSAMPGASLVLDTVLRPELYGAVDHLRRPAVVEDVAAHRRTTSPCVVEIALPAHDVERVLAAALWYVEAALRGKATALADERIDLAGRNIPPDRILGIRDLASGRDYRPLR